MKRVECERMQVLERRAAGGCRLEAAGRRLEAGGTALSCGPFIHLGSNKTLGVDAMWHILIYAAGGGGEREEG